MQKIIARFESGDPSSFCVSCICFTHQQAPKELDARLEFLGGQRLAPIFLDDFGLFKEVGFLASLSHLMSFVGHTYFGLKIHEHHLGIQSLEAHRMGQHCNVFWYGCVRSRWRQ
jgi:hypothetical protein